MNQSNTNTKQLWWILALLAVAIALIVGMDSLPAAFTASENVEETQKNDADDTDITTPAPSVGKVAVAEDDNTLSLTFLGECAPGSPYGTTAYGSFNAIAEENGTSYFFSNLAAMLSEDDLTVAANRCLFTDTPENGDAACIAPTKNLTVFSDGHIDVLAHLSPEISDAAQSTADLFVSAGLNAAVSGTVHRIERHGVTAAILYEQIKKSTNTAVLSDKIREIKSTSDFVVLYFYGGEENSHIPEDWLRTTLYACIDAGVSLAVGCGTNVLRPMEAYGGGTIFYSLGSLVDGTALVPENAAVLVEAEIAQSDSGEIQSEITLIPCYVYDEVWQPAIMTDEADKATVHQFMKEEATLPIKTETK